MNIRQLRSIPIAFQILAVLPACLAAHIGHICSAARLRGRLARNLKFIRYTCSLLSVRMLACLLLGCFLTACVPLLLVGGGATVGGAVVYDKRSTVTMASDRDNASRALAALYNDPEIKSQTHITVAVFNRLLLLVGQAPTPALRDRAYQIVVNTAPKVKRIYNEITVQPSLSSAEASNDTWLTTKVKSAMLAEKGLGSTQIKVVTENKSVYLMGLTTPKQADLAAVVASQVSGVARVVKLFEYEQ